MSPFHLKRLVREWVALLAILAMVLGPLALVTSKSLNASERIARAAGHAQFALCVQGDSQTDLHGKTGGGACDHCRLVEPLACPSHPSAPVVSRNATAIDPGLFPAGQTVGISIHPPARAPPVT